STAYDLAYYLLTYLWKPVPETDAELLGGGYRYNMQIPERQVARLYKGSNGFYTLNAETSIGYAGKYVLNATETQPGKNYYYQPFFSPIDGLGFETPGVTPKNHDTDSGCRDGLLNGFNSGGSNYLYTMHARGSFVYFHDENQEFTFVGDDDVYFYLNGSIALDLGAAHTKMSRTLKLNDAAEELGLVDGNTYTFDMFYAERSPSQANMNFSTNIQIVSRDGKTSKVQYAHTNDGEDLVNQTTGLGQPIEDHQTVNVGEVVAYGFGILNDKDTTLTNASFRDDSLGVNVSPDSLILCDKDNGFRKNNGIETTINNIRVYYRSHTEGTVTTAAPQEISYHQLLEILDQGTSPFTGSYFVKMQDEDQLKTLLARGIPVGCQMMVYGFLRRTVVEDLSYTNTVHSLCYYVPQGENTVYPVIGEAHCHLHVPENSSLPQVRKLEVVLDYGKAVSVPLIEIPDLIHFEDGSFARVGDLVGFLADSPMNDVYHGMLLKERPAGLQSAPEVTTFNGKQGTFTMEATALSYQPTQFLTQTERVYAVVELHDFYCSENGTGAYSYVVAEITFTPAHVMYYETDFAPDSNIFTMTQVGSFEDSYAGENERYQEWTSIDDETDAADPNQDYERLNGTVYHTDIAREYIPAEAFFVDFDGEGYERRYRDNPQYSGVDFDKETAWYSHNTRNSSYNKHTLDAAAGTMVLSNIMSKNANGDYLGAWIQTILPGGDIGSEALRLAAGKDHYAQVRFRVENCVSYAVSGNISLFLSNSQDEETEGDVAIETQRVKVPLSNAEVLSGNYMTVKIPLDGSYYANSETIDTIRLYIAGYTDDGSKQGKITIDYIYVGPKEGMEDDVYGNYLFVGFDDTVDDRLRYGSSIYGANTSGKNYRDLDKASAWVSASAGNTIRIENSCIVFEDTLDDSTIPSSEKSRNFNYVHAGAWKNNQTNVDFVLPIAYTPTMNDFCQIRIKFENAAIVPNEAFGLAIEYSQGHICGKALLDESYLDSGFHTITFPLDAPYWKKHWNESNANLEWLHPVVYNLQGKNNSTTGAKFTIDYIFIGPEHLLDRVDQHVDPVSQPLDHLFFDFTDNDAAKLRYSNPVYGSSGVNYDLRNNWSVDIDVGDTAIESISGGTVTFKDTGAQTWNYIHSAANYWDTPLAFTPGKNDYLRIRMKIDKGTAGTASDGIMAVALENFEGENFFSYGREEYSFADYADGEYHIFTVPLDTEDYLREDILTAVRPVISGTQNCTITVDYIYVGPLTESNPSAPSLYFGFGNRGSGHWNTDSLRYDSDTYGFLNYDTNSWLSESEAVASNLTESVYGWGTAGNEDRGAAVADEIKDYIPAFPPVETVTYPAIEVSTQPDTGHMELTVKEGTTAPIGIQTYPSVSSTRYYWRHFMQALNYHPAEENIAQVRFKTENLTIGEDFAVKLMYLPAGASAYCTSAPLRLAPQMPMNPEEDYVVMTVALDDSFNNASAVERLRLVFEGVSANNGEGRIILDYVYAGMGRIAPEPVYGYDSSYLNDTKLSNGSSYVVTGRGVKTQYSKDKYTEASFSFRGTGFDIISRTGMNQGAIRVEVRKKGADKATKTLTVNNKGELELYQIPVVSVQGLEYGDYDVTLWVNAPVKSPYDFLSHKGNFHFDAVRIYDPMGEDTGLDPEVLHTYLVDTEGYASVKEVRNILLSAEDFASQIETEPGAIFVDSAETPKATVPATDASGEPIPSSTATVIPEGITVNGHMTASATTYDKIGPKNEVYLAPGQAVAFMLKISTEYVPTSVDVGVKTIKANEPAKLVAGIVTKDYATANGLLQVAGRRDVTIRSATAQYYALPIDTEAFFPSEDQKSRYCYIVLYNNSTEGTITNVLSVTDIKVAYDEKPEIGLPQDAITDKEIQKRSAKAEEPYFDFMVDGQTLEAAALVMKAVLETPILAEGGKLMHSLNLASDISINYVVPKAALADYQSFYLEVRIPGQEEALRIEPVEKDGYHYFTLEGLTAVQMNDEITATLYMEKDGRSYYWEADHYSIAQYAYAQFNKEGANSKLKTLCADLLRYGAKAQIFKGYRTDSLADANMTDAHRAHLSDMDSVTFGNTNKVLNDLENAPISWAGKALNLESKVAVKYIFSTANYTGELKDLSLRMTYTDLTGKTVTATVTEPEAYKPENSQYAFSFDGLLAAELRTVLSAQIYAGNSPVSVTLQYSPDTYGNNKEGTLGTLCKALFAYSDSAKSYFIGK
ncbi:MAG: fibro-slime domain-containing protein, partial [Oscillospiraceae bacterium]|nr:fibro-slime domain-containing protein [Oscillospiraceae bacterium]